jgi:ADP-ribose pyrophosphatase YjhB (NUDIX family)
MFGRRTTVLKAFNISIISFILQKLTIPYSLQSRCNEKLEKQHQKAFRFFSSTKYIGDNILPYQDDKYGGVFIDSEFLPQTELEFLTRLKSSLQYWKYHEKRGVWLKIPISKTSFINAAVSEGFLFHHAEKDYLMLNNWLSEDENRMPPNASHQIGVGSVVLNDDGKILLVQENSGPLKNMDVWKLPTGLVDVGEDIHEAACREVFEETGIETEFENVLCFRQAHGALFGKSDIFFVCVLKLKKNPLLNNNDQKIKIQPSEIAKCEWLDPEVYFQQDFFKKSGVYSRINENIKKYIAEKELIKTKKNEKLEFVSPSQIKLLKLPIGFRPGHNNLYYIEDDSK